MNILIEKDLKELTKDFFVGVLECEVKVYNEVAIKKIIEELERKVANEVEISDVVNMETIIDGRNAYKKYGKDPSRYRLAVESLYRRLSKGNKLYRINNVVDLGNIISLETRRSVAVLDYDKIEGNIIIRLGTDSDEFYGIGRGKLNIKNIPLYADSIGPFGSTTSDTERTKITDKTTKILLFIISFNGKINLAEELEYASSLYCEYAKGSKVVTYIK